MKTIATLIATIAILATPASSAQRTGGNLPLIQVKPQILAGARKTGGSKVQYMNLKLKEVFITGLAKPKGKPKNLQGFTFVKKLDKASPVLW